MARSALSRAEVESCRAEGCFVGARPPRLVLYRDEFATASVRNEPALFDIVVSKGMLDFVTATASATVEEFFEDDPKKASEAGLGGWFERLNAAAGRPCADLSPLRLLAAPPPSDEKRGRLHKAEKTILEFLLSHELAHVVHGADCGSHSVDALEIEKTCDRIAYERLKQDGHPPALVALWLVGMEQYENLFAPEILGALQAGQRSYGEVFPARAWGQRARAVVETWRSDCESPVPPKMCAGDLWRDAARLVETFTRIPKPAACTLAPGAPPPPAAIHEADRCAELESDDVEHANYNIDGRPNIVTVDLPYRNACSRPIACRVGVASGNVPREGRDRHQYWAPFVSTERVIRMVPGETSRVGVLLRWSAPQDRMPSVRYPETTNSEGLLACSFTGPAMAQLSGFISDAESCRELADLVKAGESEFTSLYGDTKAHAADRTTGIESAKHPSGATSCTIYPADWASEARLDCELSGAGGAPITDGDFDAWMARLDGCLDARVWRSGPPVLGASLDTAWKERTYRRGERSPVVELERWTSLRGRPTELELSVTAPRRDDSDMPPPPRSASMPRVELANLDAALEFILAATRDGAKLGQGSRIDIHQEQRPRHFEEADRCYSPDATVENGSCDVSWRCSSRAYFTEPERRARFDQVVASMIARLKKDPGWKPRNDARGGWAPFVRPDTYLWMASRRGMSVEIEGAKGERDIDIRIHGTVGTSTPICQK